MPALSQNIIKAFLIILLTVSSYLISSSYFFLQFSVLALIILLSLSFISRLIKSLSPLLTSFDLGVIIFGTLMLIFKTGSASSPFLFLLYFIIFTVALLIDPLSAIILSSIVSVIFLITPYDALWGEIIKTFSIFVVTPLALLLTSKYKQFEKTQEKLVSLETLETKRDIWTREELNTNLKTMQNTLALIATDESTGLENRERIQRLIQSIDEVLQSEKKMESEV